MKMIEIRRIEIIVKCCDCNGRITTEMKYIPLSKNEFDDIINNKRDWRDVVKVYLDTIISEIKYTDIGIKYCGYKTNNTYYVYLSSLIKKYI